ncbi:MAG: type II secretion system protein GspC [Anaeromyxobacter sp.]
MIEDAPAKPVRPQNCADPAAQPVKTQLNLSLVAGTLAEPARYSVATLADLSAHQTISAGIGDPVQGARLIGLQRMRDERDVTGNGFRMVAILCNEGTKEYVDDGGGGGDVLASGGPNLGYSPVPPPGRPPAVANVEGIRNVGKDRYEIDRTALDAKLNNLSEFATQARIVPSFKNNVANGFKLIAVQPGSLYSAIGIENGDVIQRVNGYELNSPEKALELYTKLREAGRVTLELERGGQVVRKEFTITGP